MGAIGLVTGTIDAGFVGQLTTITIRAPIEIRRNRGKAGDVQPDYRILSEGAECGVGWLRRAEGSGKLFVSLALEAPEFGPRRIYARLERAAGQDNPDVYALAWSPMD